MTKIEALQMCLEYIETDKHERKYVRHAIKAALEQPVQEPVACRFCHSEKGSRAWQCYHCGEIDDVQQPAPLPVNPTAQEMHNAAANLALMKEMFGNANQPAARPWVGLTEDEKFEIAALQYGWEDLLIAAEAKLKELNT